MKTIKAVLLLLFMALLTSGGLQPGQPAAERAGDTSQRKTIFVTGIGIPPSDSASYSIRREMARRSAVVDAQRKLVEALAEIRTGSGRTLKEHMGGKNFNRKVKGFIKGYTVRGERESSNGSVEIDLELPLGKQGGLSRYLAR
jgi:hypothetical protein